jgi:predicted  nucleic acid-binding Zn-ribbon protein
LFAHGVQISTTVERTKVIQERTLTKNELEAAKTACDDIGKQLDRMRATVSDGGKKTTSPEEGPNDNPTEPSISALEEKLTAAAKSKDALQLKFDQLVGLLIGLSNRMVCPSNTLRECTADGVWT